MQYDPDPVFFLFIIIFFTYFIKWDYTLHQPLSSAALFTELLLKTIILLTYYIIELPVCYLLVESLTYQTRKHTLLGRRQLMTICLCFLFCCTTTAKEDTRTEKACDQHKSLTNADNEWKRTFWYSPFFCFVDMRRRHCMFVWVNHAFFPFSFLFFSRWMVSIALRGFSQGLKDSLKNGK